MRRLTSAIVLVLMSMAVVACSPGKLFGPTLTPTQTSTLTPTLTLTSTPTITSTPTFTPTPGLPVANGTRLPLPLARIAVNDAGELDLVHLASFTYPDMVSGIQGLAFTPSNTMVTVSTGDRLIRVIDLDGSILKTIGPLSENHYRMDYTLLKVSSDGIHVAVAEKYQTLDRNYPYCCQSVVMIRNLQDETEKRDKSLSVGITAISKDLGTIAQFLNYAYDGNVHVYFSNADAPKDYQYIVASGRDSMAMTADGSIVATDYQDYILLWRTSDGTRFDTLPDAGNPLVFSEDGTLLAAKTDEFIQIWKVADGTLLQSIPYSGWIDDIVFSPDSRLLVAAIVTDVFIWNVADGVLLKTIIDEQDVQNWIDTVVFSPDGEYLAYGRDKKIEIYAISTGGLQWPGTP